MIGNNTSTNLSNGGFILQPISNQQSTQKSSLSQAQLYQDEQELAAIFHNKELELQKQIKQQQEALQVCTKYFNFSRDYKIILKFNIYGGFRS